MPPQWHVARGKKWIDRAVHLCSEILDYAGPKKLETIQNRFALSSLVADVAREIETLTDGKSRVVDDIENGLEVTADREQLFRVFQNMCFDCFLQLRLRRCA